jgi:hypothetical protein
MVNGLHLYSTLPPSGHSKRFTILPNIHPFMHTFIQRRRCQPRRATASLSGAVRVRRLAQGHLDTQLGGAGDRASSLQVSGPPALPPAPPGLYDYTSLFQQRWEIQREDATVPPHPHPHHSPLPQPRQTWRGPLHSNWRHRGRQRPKPVSGEI